MSIGRINTPIDLIIVEKVKDKEGFTRDSLNSLAKVRAYKGSSTLYRTNR